MRAVALNAWRLALGVAVSPIAAGCDGCGCGAGTDGLRVRGEHAFVRCLAADPPPAHRWKAGGLSLRIEGRTLEVQGAPRPVRVAAFRGPGPSPRRLDGAVGALAAEDGPHLALVLGGLGPGERTVTRNLQALAALEVPVLVLAGGGDEAPVLDAAFAALDGAAADRVLDVRGLREVHVGPDTLVLVSGAPRGRYARSADACGYRPSDLERIAGRVGAPAEGERRWLVSWAVPAGGSLSHGYGDVGAGDPGLADLREAIDARGGLYAWPGTRAMSRQSLEEAASPKERRRELVVARIAGPVVERAGGSRVRGAARLELGADGGSLRGRAP